MGLIEALLWLLLWLLLSVAYIYIARRFDIVDHPNHRSSHQHVTIRGGGIIFWLGLMISVVIHDYFTMEFALAVGLLGLASFIDDLISIPAFTRILIQLLSVLLLVWLNSYFHTLINWNWIAIPVFFIVLLGSMNIYNFMDGINGLSVCYTLLALVSLSVFDQEKTNSYIFIALPLLVMALFNVRPKGRAVFFSGDIGSISAGFTLVYCILIICIRESSIAYLSLILIYLIDGGWTIIIRLVNRENVFEAHRSHVFQLLANELNWGHLKVVFIYIVLQLTVNLILYFELKTMVLDQTIWFFALFIILSILYFLVRNIVTQAVQKQQTY